MPNLSPFAILSFAFVVLILFSFAKKQKGSSIHISFPYHTKYILTKPEYSFYRAIKPLMDQQNYLICPKVGLKDLFEINGGTKNRQRYFMQIAQKHIDFLICDENLKPLFAIELDDKSHKRAEVQKRDEFKNRLFAHTGLPLYRVPTSSSYSMEYVRKYIDGKWLS